MKRRRNRRRKNSLTFQKLEPRQLLAGDVVGIHQVDASLPTGANIVANGDFETVTAGADNFFNVGEITAWQGRDPGQEFNIFSYNLGDESSPLAVYGNVLDLDSSAAQFDRVYQDLNTQANTEYLLAFDYRSHPAASATASEFSQDFEVWWNGELVGSLTAGDEWTTGTISVTSSEFDVTELQFNEVAEESAPGGDGIGALLDNIRVVEANEVAIENGSFELTAEDRSLWFRGGQDVAGWSSIANDAGNRWVKIAESDTSATPAPGSAIATDGNNYLNLDTTQFHRDVVFTDVDTVAGETYYVTFDLRTNGDQVASPDELRVRWNDAWATTILGTSEWTNHALVLTATSDLTQLAFLEPGETTGNGSGPLIDNIRIFSIAEATNSGEVDPGETNPGGGEVDPGETNPGGGETNLGETEDEIVVDLNGSETGLAGSATFFPQGGAQPIGQGVSLSRNLSNNLTSATVQLAETLNGGQEVIGVLSSAVPEGVTLTRFDSATGELRLEGEASVEDYEAVLQTLSYFNAADNVGTSSRLVTVTVEDSTLPVGQQTATATLDLGIETNQANIDEFIINKFIADNDLDAVQVQEGLYAVIDDPGTGINPDINSQVRVAYDGRLITLDDQNNLINNPVSFDTSPAEGIEFPLRGVIPGWQLGIPEFAVGGNGTLIISSALGYGTTGFGSSIPPNSVLVFDVNLLEITT